MGDCSVVAFRTPIIVYDSQANGYNVVMSDV